ncbi:hypothetical protein ACWGH3_32805 [Streptomyces sp. NPDC054884]
MTSPRTDLSAFAAGLAARLPGTWTSEYQRHARYAEQFPRTDELWDAALGASYESVPVDARLTLYAHGFQYHPHQAAFLLPTAYRDSGRALRVHGVVQQLTAKGFGVNLRRSAPTTSVALPPTSPKTASTTSHTR